MRKNLDLKAVWDDDLNGLLASLGILEDLISGKINCVVCYCRVNTDNLGTIIPGIDSIQLTCDDTNCVHVVTSQKILASNG